MELLAPAGDMEKLKTAIDFDADAIYFGGRAFSLRAGAGGLDTDEIKEALGYAHGKGRKCYLTVNIYAHNEDIGPLRHYLASVRALGIDGYLVSDPGIIMMIKEIIPDAVIHLSTQANMTNYETARFWYDFGVKRLVLARELSLAEIRTIRSHIPSDMELEAFVHGSMCISYSGRCLLSSFMTGRDSNRGACAHPCRWQYVLEEEKRPGEYFPVEEDGRGTYIMNSNDLCMVKHIDDLADAGVCSAKIEGRGKSAFYTACTVNGYRMAIDAYARKEYTEDIKARALAEVSKASHRNFTTGFYYGRPGDREQNYTSSSYTREWIFVGLVRSYDTETGFAEVEQRNKMTVGEELEIFGPYEEPKLFVLNEMYDLATGEPTASAPHPQQMLRISIPFTVKKGYMIRKKKGDITDDI